MYYKLRCNSTQLVIYYKLHNYYKLQRNIANSEFSYPSVNFIYSTKMLKSLLMHIIGQSV